MQLIVEKVRYLWKLLLDRYLEVKIADEFHSNIISSKVSSAKWDIID